MKALLIGLGEMGRAWYRALAARSDMVLVGVADANPATWEKIVADDAAASARPDEKIPANPPCAFFTDAAAAMDELRPDFIVNVTPPHVHLRINGLAFERNIPVLCEKPIAESAADVRAILEYAHGQKLMIAENYRYMAQIRHIKSLLDENHVGEIQSVNIFFSRRHSMTNYHRDMEHPLLLDVTIHHLDMLRYLAGDEAESVFADFFTPAGSWYKGYSNASLSIKMANGARVLYGGSLDAHENSTDWYGDWTIRGTKATLKYANDRLTSCDGQQSVPLPLPENTDDGMGAILDNWLAFLQGGALPATHISDNMKTDAIARAALRSFRTKEDQPCP